MIQRYEILDDGRRAERTENALFWVINVGIAAVVAVTTIAIGMCYGIF